MKELSFAFYATRKNFQNSAELRTSFLMNIAGMAVNNTAFIVLWVYFVKSVGVIGGWTAADIIGLQGFVTMCFGLVFSAGAGLPKLADYVASGSFDNFMLSPKNLLVRLATSAFRVSSLGDLVFGIACLALYAFLLPATGWQLLMMGLLVIVSSTVFLAATIAICSVSFFFTEAWAVTGSLFEIFLTPSIFHGGAFQGALRFVFTFIIPSLLVGALPVEIVRDVSLGQLALVSALAAFWLAASIFIFNRAVRRYESSNFMTFGN